MMNQKETRWEQRFQNFERALLKLTQASTFFEKPENIPNELEKEGVIQRFEYTYELAWNVMKDYLEAESPGTFELLGSKTTLRAGFKVGLIDDEKGWIDMVNCRQASSHTYQEAIANEIFEKAIGHFCQLFIKFQQKMTPLRGQ